MKRKTKEGRKEGRKKTKLKRTLFYAYHTPKILLTQKPKR
jgi:hypothetical protein